jgi:hypothetical protein
MKLVGKKEVGKQRKPDGIFGSSGLRSLPFLGLVLSALVLAAMPGSAMISDVATASVANQPSSCPCNGQCSPQQVSQVILPQTTDADIVSQAAPASYSRPGTVQQPVANAPAADVTHVTTNASKSAITGHVTSNKNITGLMDSFSLTGLNRFMPSLSADNYKPVGMTGNGFLEQMKTKWPTFF